MKKLPYARSCCCVENGVGEARVKPLQPSMIGSSGKPGPNHKDNQIRAVGEAILQDL
jgi:hypothetical protein